jgi:acyl transferase domain-containing protein
MRPAGSRRRGWQVLLLSARTGTALADAAGNLAGHLDRHDNLDIADVAYTLQAGRRRFPLRRHLVCRGRAEASVALQTLNPLAEAPGVDGADARQVVFLFPGGAAYHPDAASELYQSEPAFAEQLDLCADLLRPRLGYDLRRVLFPSTWRGPDVAGDGRPGVPAAVFSLQWSLAHLWRSWGVRPAAMVGHGDGEYVAAALASVIDLADALDVTVARAEASSPDEFARMVAGHERKPPQVPFISGLTGTWISPQQAVDVAYWVRHRHAPERFAVGIREVLSEPGRVLLEVGPGNRLTSRVARQAVALSSLPPAREGGSDLAHLLDTVGRLWQTGVELDWDAFHGAPRPWRVPLPGYPFQRRRYWIGPDSGRYQPMGHGGS